MHATPHPKRFKQGDYLTDQRRLFRVLEIVPAKFWRRAAILEDCRTLDAVLFAPKALKRMQLQLVRTAPAAVAQSPTACDDRSPVPVLD